MGATELFSFFLSFSFFYATVPLLASEKVGCRAQARCHNPAGLGAEEAAGWQGLDAGSGCGGTPEIVCPKLCARSSALGRLCGRRFAGVDAGVRCYLLGRLLQLVGKCRCCLSGGRGSRPKALGTQARILFFRVPGLWEWGDCGV